MKKTIILLITVLLANTLYGQDDLIDENDTTEGWKVKGIVGLGFSQVALSNWSAGGENSFAGNHESVIDALASDIVVPKNLLKYHYFTPSVMCQPMEIFL